MRKIMLLKKTETNLMKLQRKIKDNEEVIEHKIKVPMPKVKVTFRSEVKIMCQQQFKNY